MSERKFASTSIRDSEDKLGLTPEGVNKLLADTNTTVAKTKGFTKIGDVNYEDGLIFTSLIKLLDAGNDGDEMAGVSGIAGDDKEDPAFWAGGTYAEALSGVAKAIIKHDGSVKFAKGSIGDLIIDPSGRLYIKDEQEIERLRIGNFNLPSLESLRAAAETTYAKNFSDISFLWNGTGSFQDVTITPEVLIIPEDGTDLTITGDLSISAQDSEGFPISGSLTLGLKSGDAPALSVDSVFGNERVGIESKSVNVVFRSMPAGSYKLEARFSANYPPPSGYSIHSVFAEATNLRIDGLLRNDVTAVYIGKNGLMSFHGKYRHLFINENAAEGKPYIIAGSDTDLPGVLLSATVAAGGGWASVWGAKKSESLPVNNSTGRYTVYHTVGHSNYQVNAIPNTSNKTCHIVSKQPGYFIIEWRSVASSPALINTGFDFQIIGNNYA